ncbi:unnamed protein product [Acanthoscelides obtectus]|uniref:Syntaxin N-terminal domain-containing protein n=1 Tax=Acanthoscelides obtectus TaxID=200917 RepID=A0A9P0KHP5_ACAOB|nr:unnamed protein product [Acanthoscelides obtectus]CAK1625699.1 Syntaxin-1A [Acanthoscelides obtectus]
MTKDRLGELLKAQKTSKKDVELDVEQENNNEGGKSDLKKTFERAEVISQWLQGIEKNVEAIKEYESRINDLMYNQTDLNEKIDTLFQNNTSICHKINGKLKEIDEELKQTAEDSAEGRIKAIQYNTLKTRYIETFKSNNNALENYRNVQKANLDAQLRAKGIRMTDEELVHLLEENTDMQLFTDNVRLILLPTLTDAKNFENKTYLYSFWILYDMYITKNHVTHFHRSDCLSANI